MPGPGGLDVGGELRGSDGGLFLLHQPWAGVGAWQALGGGVGRGRRAGSPGPRTVKALTAMTFASWQQFLSLWKLSETFLGGFHLLYFEQFLP